MTTHDEIEYRHILVPLDGSDFAMAAMPTARALADAFQAEVETITVAGNDNEADRLRSQVAPRLTRSSGRSCPIHSRRGSGGRDRTRRAGAEALPGVSLDPRPRPGRRSDRGLRRAVFAATIYRASRRRRAAGRPTSHAFVGKGAARRPTSTWTAPTSIPRIVACVDGSPESELVLPVAAAWARALTLSMTIVTVAENVLPPLDAGSPTTRRFGPSIDGDAYITRLVESWNSAAPDVTGRVVSDAISPAAGLRNFLGEEAAGLLAVTTHARGG